MTKYWRFYLPAAHPTGLTGQVGGAIGSEELKPHLNALFSEMESSDSVAKTQYRKVFAKQVETATFQNVSIELGNVEHTGHVSFYVGDPTGYADNAQTFPDVVPSTGFSGNYIVPITGLATSSKGDTLPIWVRQDIPAGAGDDALASFTLKVRAVKL